MTMRALPALGCALLSTAWLTAQTPPATDAVPTKPNRLDGERSSYLRQHRLNPVDWYPWGDEALQRARREQKPIFVSIGYSACHWCHVMARESFADPLTAAVLNEHFVCIKIDREERPDLDELYMSAVQAMDHQGGWPLSVWLTPDGQPFYGGTYFPPEDAFGRPGFRRVCTALATTWRERRDEVLEGAAELGAHLQRVLAPELAPGEPDAALLQRVLPQALERYDPQHHGLAEPPAFAPKFPQAVELTTLLRLGDPAARALVTATLDALQRSGMHDQVGFGFHRYSTDRAWRVPHFEKMLYDNALLASLYAEAFVATGEPRFATTARRTLDYLLRELRSPDGGFFASQDAQSDGREGAYFVWRRSEFEALFGERAAAAARCFGVTADGNFDGANVLWLADESALSAAERERCRTRLFEARQQRVAPAIDDKLLAGWNGLTLVALCDGFRALGEARYREAARALGAFVCDVLIVDGRVHRSAHGREARGHGFLEDHAALADGLLALFEIDPEPRWLSTAAVLLRGLEPHFGAPDGSFWFTADDHQTSLVRSKTAHDAATPSGTALAVRALLRGGLLLGDDVLYQRGLAALRAHHTTLRDLPAAAPALVQSLLLHLAEPREVVVAGAPDDPRTLALLQAAWRQSPALHVVAHVHDVNRAALVALSPVFDQKLPIDGAPAAYVCRRGACEAPVLEPERLRLGSAAMSGGAEAR